MNKRLVELQSEAFNLCEKRESGFVSTDEWFKIYGELIVKECAEFVSNERKNDDYGRFVANRIKQHFGVE